VTVPVLTGLTLPDSSTYSMPASTYLSGNGTVGPGAGAST